LGRFIVELIAWMLMCVRIEAIEALKDYRAVEDLQREVWRLEDVETVPDHVLITAQKNGGLVLGAFEEEPEGGQRLVGFVFGFLGRTGEGVMKHCSHMLGVSRSHHGRGIGYRLKLAQREHVLEQGLSLITWTFDPLESPNANLNFHKLGATCRTYFRDVYGEMRDELNAGLPTDRFQVDWQIDSEHVRRRVDLGQTASLDELRAEGAKLVNDGPADRGLLPPEDVPELDGTTLLLEIPADFQRIRSNEPVLARRWRTSTRRLFEAAFAAGYWVVDSIYEGRRSTYVLFHGGVPT
jgi:predicted GNAT superfamily acetyltransferase